MKEAVFDNSFEPVVGQYYYLWCAKMVGTAGHVIHVPIINNLHADPEIGKITEEHYHVDGRFVDYYSTWLMSVKEGKTNAVVTPSYKAEDGYNFQKLVIRKLKCKGLDTGVKPPKYAKKYWNWYKKQVGKEVKNNRCPHRGENMLIKENTLVCPLHGLTACKKTNKIISI